MKDTKLKKIQWHPGFIAAMELEFIENRRDLQFEREYNLNTKPLEIDLLLIKKEPEVKIENEIGEIFLTHNLWEYKSYLDHLNVDTFYKVIGYGCLYKAHGKLVDEIKADDITLSFVRETKPEKLFRFLKESGYEIENPHVGIYRIHDVLHFRVQIIITKELEPENHIWLKALSNHLKKEELKMLFQVAGAQKGKHEKEMADSVLDVCIRANLEMAEQLRGDGNMSEALLELMEPILTEKVERGIEQGKIIAYYDMDLSTGEIARKMQMDIQDVEAVIKAEEERVKKSRKSQK